MNWKNLASENTVNKVISQLKKRNIEAFFVNDGEGAKEKIIELIPPGSHVQTATSVTLETIGMIEEIENSGNFVSVKKQYMSLDHKKDAEKIRVLRSTPQVELGSVHAVTEEGQIVIASNTGSQLAPYAYSAGKVIWVAGTQKIVKDLDEAFRRLHEYVVPLEEKHMQELYNVGTNVSKILIFNKEKVEDRVKLIFVNKVLGF